MAPVRYPAWEARPEEIWYGWLSRPRGKAKRTVSRRHRLFVPYAIYHVYCRVSRGEMVFQRDGETERLVEELQRVKTRHDISVFAWVVMSNHYHVALRTADIPLWRTMLELQSRVAKRHNRLRRVLGPLWQSRYKARMVEDQQYLDQLLAYIHLNPVAAGIVDDPAKYRWSGHNELVGSREPELVDVDQTLLSFAATRGSARDRYLDFIRYYAEARGHQIKIRSLPWWSAVTDDEELVDPHFGNAYWDYRGKKCEIERPKIPLDTLLNLACEFLEISPSALISPTTTRPVSVARAFFASLAIDRYGHRAIDVAAVLSKNPCSVSRWRSRAFDWADDSSSRRTLDEFDRYIVTRYHDVMLRARARTAAAAVEIQQERHQITKA